MVGQSTELIVDEKHRVTLPKALRKSLGITSGTKLEAEERSGEIIIRPAVPVRNPTDSIWGLAPRIVQRNPKQHARQAIANRKRLGK
jgi:AbrB family looped-hinge helix DNA binding protein